MNMAGKRMRLETHGQIQILSEKGYNTHQITAKLQLAQMTVTRSINNFKANGKYGFEKPTGCPKCTTKRFDDARILYAKKLLSKTAKGFQTNNLLLCRCTS